MKKLFGSKQKPPKGPLAKEASEEPIPTPIHQMHATFGSQQAQQLGPPQALHNKSSTDEERWEVIPSSHPDQQQPLPTPRPPALTTPSRSGSLASLPPGASPPLPSPPPPRSPSPFSAMSNASTRSSRPLQGADRDRERDHAARKRAQQQPSAPVALGILRSLDPPRASLTVNQTRSYSEERYAPSERYTPSEGIHTPREREREYVEREKKEKKGFWSRDKDKDKERDRFFERERDRGRDRDRRDEESSPELTRMIGYVTATASEDWALVMDVCERASANESSAKEAVRALRREFKYGEPPAQLSAARLWAIMLRNSSEMFISQTTTRKFLDTLEDLLTSSRTSPVVRERLLDVVAAAAYASGTSKKDGKSDRDGFRGLWRRVKPLDKPEEGMPFDTDDAMFNPPVSARQSLYDIPLVAFQEPSPLPSDAIPPTPPHPHRKRKSPTRNRIIPPEEDMRRLQQECTIGKSNAALLSEALVLAKPEDLKKQKIIREFHAKCLSSQELIYAQIPWASAGAERSRQVRDQDGRKRTFSTDSKVAAKLAEDGSPIELTMEETLLDALLAANTELVEALRQYDDIERVAMERKAQHRSRKETRMDRRQMQQLDEANGLGAEHSTGGAIGRSSSRSPSPSSYSPPPSLLVHPRPHHASQYSSSDLNLQSQSLAPPPSAPHGPRLPSQISTHSRTPSPGTPILDSPVLTYQTNGHDLLDGAQARHYYLDERQRLSAAYDDDDDDDDDDDEFRAYSKPSAKALGKQKAVEPEEPEASFEPDDIYVEHKDNIFPADERNESDQEDSSEGVWHPPPVRYVYDAAAERTQQRIREGHALVVNGVH